jgi:hypothetical protein
MLEYSLEYKRLLGECLLGQESTRSESTRSEPTRSEPTRLVHLCSVCKYL